MDSKKKNQKNKTKRVELSYDNKGDRARSLDRKMREKRERMQRNWQ